MPNSQANLSNVFILWLFIATMSLQVSSKDPAKFIVDWRTSAPVGDPRGQAEFAMKQESKCNQRDRDVDFSARFAAGHPSDWKMVLTHSEDKPFTDRKGQCSARSKATLALTLGDTIEFHIRLNQLCSDETCDINNLSGEFSCAVIKAPEYANMYFSINSGTESRCKK